MITKDQETYANPICYRTGAGALRPLIVKVLELENTVEGLKAMLANVQAAVASDRQRAPHMAKVENRASV
jgi:hypothetical protein